MKSRKDLFNIKSLHEAELFKHQVKEAIIMSFEGQEGQEEQKKFLSFGGVDRKADPDSLELH